MNQELKVGDVVIITKKRSKRKGKLGRVDHVDHTEEFVLVLWQNGYPSLIRASDLQKIEGAEFVFDDKKTGA